jgi:hypothetical protein
MGRNAPHACLSSGEIGVVRVIGLALLPGNAKNPMPAVRASCTKMMMAFPGKL